MNSTNISVFDRYYSDVLLYGRFAPQTGIIERINFPLWAIIGIPGSLFNIIVWSNRSMRRSGSAAAAVFQASLGVIDLLFFIINIPWQLHIAWHLKTLDYPVVCEVFPVLNYFIQYMSPTLAFAFTLERFLAVCYPFKFQKFIMCLNEQNALKFVLLLCIICILTAGVQSLVFTFNDKICSTRISIETVGSLPNKLYTNWLIITEILFFLCIPLTCLILNLFVIRVLKISNKHKRRQTLSPNSNDINNNLKLNSIQTTNSPDYLTNNTKSSTLTLLCTSFYMIAAHLSVTVALTIYKLLPYGNIYLTDEQIENDIVWTRYFQFFTIRVLIDCFAMSHYAAKFPIYLFTSKQFRENYVKLFCKCFKQSNSFNSAQFLDKQNLLHRPNSNLTNPNKRPRPSSKNISDQLTNKTNDFSNDGINSNLLKNTNKLKNSFYLGLKLKHSDTNQSRNRPMPGLSRTVLNKDGERIKIV